MKSHMTFGRVVAQIARLSLLLGLSSFALNGCGGPETLDSTGNDSAAATASQGASNEKEPLSNIEPASSFAQPGGSWRLTCGYPGAYFRQTDSGVLMFQTICTPKNPHQIVVNTIKAFSCTPWCLWNDNGALRCGNC